MDVKQICFLSKTSIGEGGFGYFVADTNPNVHGFTFNLHGVKLMMVESFLKILLAELLQFLRSKLTNSLIFENPEKLFQHIKLYFNKTQSR